MRALGLVVACVLAVCLVAACGDDAGEEEDPRAYENAWYDQQRAMAFDAYGFIDESAPACEQAAAWEEWLARTGDGFAFAEENLPPRDFGERDDFLAVCEEFLTEEQALCVAHTNRSWEIECCLLGTPAHDDERSLWSAEECEAGEFLD